MSDMNGAQRPYRTALGALRQSFLRAGFFSAVINILMLTGPLYMLQIYDRVLASGSVPTLLGLFLIVVVLYGFMALYDLLRARILSRAAFRFDAMIGDLAFGRMLDPDGRGNHALRDMEILRSFLSGSAVRGLFDLPWMPIFLVAVFIIHPWLGYLTLGGAGVVVAFALFNQWATKVPMAQSMQLDGSERSFTSQALRSAEAARALGMRSAITARWRSLHNAGLVQSQRGGDRSDGFSSASRSFRLLLQSLLLTAGAYLALQQQISAGMIVGTSILAGRALAPVDQVIGQWRSVARALEAHRRLRDTLDARVPGQQYIRLPAPKGALSVRGATKLMPEGAGRDRGRILDQVSFELEPGDVLGVIGNSASGKSSLARLLVGAWQPDAGDVRLDGAALSQWASDDLGKFIGYLPQHAEVLPGTVAENIARFDPDAQENDIFAAARAAGAHDMILELPEGYATPVGTPDQPLSGGQVQRVGLARALYKMPRFIVLDEPNAHLDTQGDEALADTIHLLCEQGITVVLMTHRPGVLVRANKVLILHQGKVAKFGAREEIFRQAAHAVPNGPAKPGGQGAPSKQAAYINPALRLRALQQNSRKEAG